MIITIIQIVLAALLIIAILLQQRGAGLSGAFGGGEGSVYSTRRGAEKIIFISTIVIAVLFFGISFLRIILY
jgi:protein translocase SecG subunit